MIYDQVSWHAEGDYPTELSPENGGTHIGMFLAWVIQYNLISESLADRSPASLAAVRNREITGREFLARECDDKLQDADLNVDANSFAREYYSTNRYYEDYASVLCRGLASLYHAEDTWKNYDKIAKTITKRYLIWRNDSKWWQFWK